MAGVNNVAHQSEPKTAACSEDVVWQKLKKELDIDRKDMRRTPDGGYTGMSPDGRYDVYVKGGEIRLIDYIDTTRTENPTPIKANLCDPKAVDRLRQVLEQRKKAWDAEARDKPKSPDKTHGKSAPAKPESGTVKSSASDKAARTRGAVEWRIRQGAQIVGTAAADKVAEKNPRAAGILRGALRLLGK